MEAGPVSGAVVGRFAPSPSGRLHLGNLACSLLAWLSARSQGGRIVLRIEDLDAERCPRKYADALEEHGGVEVLLEKDSSGQALFQAAAGILHDDARRRAMEQAMTALGVRDAAERIYETVQAVMNGGK